MPPFDEPAELADTEKDLPVQRTMRPESSMWSGIALLRDVRDATLVGTVSLAEDPLGARLKIALGAEPGRYKVELSKTVIACNDPGWKSDKSGTLSIERGKRRGTLEVVYPGSSFDRDFDLLDGRAVMIRARDGKTPFACGSLEMTKGDPNLAG